MNTNALDFLEVHKAKTASHFQEQANWRKENASWLRWSQHVALALIDYMQSNGLKRNELVARLDVSPQYVSKLLSGKANLSFKSVANIEEKLNIRCFEFA